MKKIYSIFLVKASIILLLSLGLLVNPSLNLSKVAKLICLAPKSHISLPKTSEKVFQELQLLREQIETLKQDPAFDLSLNQKITLLIKEGLNEEINLKVQNPILEEAVWWCMEWPNPKRNHLLSHLLADLFIYENHNFEAQRERSPPEKVKHNTTPPLIKGILETIAKSRNLKNFHKIKRPIYKMLSRVNSLRSFDFKNYNPFRGNLDTEFSYNWKLAESSPQNLKQVQKLNQNIQKRLYYRHFFNLFDGEKFDKEEVAKRTRTAAKILPKIKEVLNRFKRVEGKWEATQPGEGTYATYVKENKIKASYITGSFVWGIGTLIENGQLVSIPPGDMDLVVVIDDERKFKDTISTKGKVSLHGIFSKDDRGYNSVRSIDLLVISTGYLRDRMNHPTIRYSVSKKVSKAVSYKNPRDAYKVASLIMNLWGSAVILEGEDVVENFDVGYQNLLAASYALYEDSYSKGNQNYLEKNLNLLDRRFQPRKSLNRILEAILQINEAVKIWNKKKLSGNKKLKPILLSKERLVPIFDALSKDLSIKRSNVQQRWVIGKQAHILPELEKLWQEYLILLDEFSLKEPLAKKLQEIINPQKATPKIQEIEISI